MATAPAPHGFHLKPLGTLAAVAAIAAAVVAIGLWVGGSEQPTCTPQQAAPPEAAELSVDTSANWEVYLAGKLDDAPVPAPSSAELGREAVTNTISVDVSEGSFDALVAGKYDVEFAAQNPNIRYVRGFDEANQASANWEAYLAGKLDDAPAVAGRAVEPSPPATLPPPSSGGHQEY